MTLENDVLRFMDDSGVEEDVFVAKDRPELLEGMLMKELDFLFFIKVWCINAVSRFFDSTVAIPSIDPLESGVDMTKVQILRGVLDTVLT